MNDPSSPSATPDAAHPIADAHAHAEVFGDGTRAALPAMPAPARTMQRRIKVTVRQPFLPDHHGHARHGLKGTNQ